MERTSRESAETPMTTISVALRREREAQGLSLTELARRARVAKSTLSQLEAGVGNPGVETLWALSLALEVPLPELLHSPSKQVVVVRAAEGEPIRSEQADYAVTLLAPAPSGTRRDVFRLTAGLGPARESEPHAPGMVEHLILSAGLALAGPVDDPVMLEPGDYIQYPGDAAHTFQALEPDTKAVMILEHR